MSTYKTRKNNPLDCVEANSEVLGSIGDCTVNDLSDFDEFKQRKKSNPKVVLPEILEYDENGVFIRLWKNAKAVQDGIGISNNAVLRCCRGRTFLTVSKGYTRIFLFRGDDIEERMKIIEERKVIPRSVTRPIQLYSINGRLRYEWKSIAEASKHTKLAKRLISDCCNGKKLSIGNQTFIYKEDNIKDRIQLIKEERLRKFAKQKKKPVDWYDKNGKLINKYMSCTEASKDSGVCLSSVFNCCTGKIKYTAKGIFLYAGASIRLRLSEISKNKWIRI